MARKTKEDALKTRAAILDAAIEVFSVQGVSRTTLADIAKKAEVTRGAIYWHFNNKEDLLGALWDQLLLPFEPMNRVSEDPDEPDPLGKLQQAHIAFFKSLEEDPRVLKLCQILFHKCESVEETGILRLHRVNCHLEGLRRIEKVLRNAIRQGQLPETLDVRMGSIAIIAFIDGLANNWVLFPNLLDTNTDLPAMLNGLREMLGSGFLRSAESK